MASNIIENLGPMDWTDEHDKALMKEVRVENPFKAKKKTTARAQIWLTIAEKLSGLKHPKFKVCMTKRSVQDRYILVIEKYRLRMRREASASGISPSYTELDQPIEECVNLGKLEDERRQKDGGITSARSEKEKENALEIRRIAMENLAQTKKRKHQEQESEEENERGIGEADKGKTEKKKKCRKTGHDTIKFLREQNTQEMKIREQELKMEENQQAIERQRCQTMMDLIQQQQQQQQRQQQQQFQALMQQQSQLMMVLLQQVNKQKD